MFFRMVFKWLLSCLRRGVDGGWGMGDVGDWEGVGVCVGGGAYFFLFKKPDLNSTQLNSTKNWRFFTQKEKKPAQNLKFSMKN